MHIKYATATCVVPFQGLRVTLTAGEAWDASDPLVRSHPTLFADVPSVVRGTGPSGVTERPVEQATAAPGEKRGTRRG
jgi:hypothetical protein